MRKLLLFFIFISIIKSNAQVRQPENTAALYDQLKTAKGEQRASLLLQLARIEFPKLPDQSMAFTQEALTIYRQENNENGQADAMNSLANMYRRKNNFTLAYELDSVSYALSRKNNYQRGIAGASLNLVPNYMRSMEYQKALSYANEAIDAGKKAELDSRFMIGIYLTRGNVYMQMKDVDRATDDYEAGYTLAEKTNDDISKQRALAALSAASRMAGDKVASLDQILRSIKMAERLQDKTALASLYLSAGNTYTTLNNTGESLAYYKKAFLLQQYISQPVVRMSVLGNISRCFMRLKEYDSAIAYSTFRLNMATAVKDSMAVAATHIDLGDIATAKADHRQAIDYYQRALTTYVQKKQAPEMTRVYNALASANLQIRQFKKAEDYLLKSYALQSRAVDKGSKRYTDYLLSKVYEETGEMDNARRFRNEYLALGGEAINAETELKINRLQADYEISKREDALALAAKEQQLKELQLQETRLRLWGTIALTGFVLILAAILYRSYRQKVKTASALQQKNERIETLMRELHHRVKNNLQVIGSVLNLQSLKLTDSNARSAIEEGKARVEAMSLLHQKMYMDDNLRAINIEEYITSLTRMLAHSFGYDQSIVQTHIQLSSKNMDVDLATPLALIINELITNAFKHAFQQVDKPVLTIELTESKTDQRVSLKVSDNGKGINLSAVSPSSFGLKLIRTFVQQLGATMDISNNKGSVFNISFNYAQ
jgi:two-component system, sensor histidine kinase PdtaS